MKLTIAVLTLALAVASTSAITHIKVDCRSVKYAKYYYQGADCKGEAYMQVAFSPDKCENTLSLLSDDASAKFAYNATSKIFTQSGYEKADCAGTAKEPGLLSPQTLKLDTCTKDIILGTTASYKIVEVSQAATYTLGDDTCVGTTIYMGSGECFVNTKITCSADNKKFHYQLWETKCDGDTGDVADAKDQETGKCTALETLAGAGTLSVISSFVIMAFVMMFM